MAQVSTFTPHVQEMLAAHPRKSFVTGDTLLACIQACFDCQQTCIACADACLSESDVSSLLQCIRLNYDCANVCEAAGKILSRQTAFQTAIPRAVLDACIVACRACGDECDKHAAQMAHCRVCADACRRCEQACAVLVNTFEPSASA